MLEARSADEAGSAPVNRRAQSERSELKLLRTATWLFAEHGFDGTSIRDISEASHMAVSAMYYYARSKEEVLEAVMQRGLARLYGGSCEALADVEGASEQLATLICFHVAFHARNPRTSRVVDQELRALSGGKRKAILAQRDAYEAVWSDVLRDGVRAGEFVDRGGLAGLALLEMCTGVAHWFRPRGRLAIEEVCHHFAEMGLAMAGAHRDGKPVKVETLCLPSPQRLLSLVAIGIEPRSRPS